MSQTLVLVLLAIAIVVVLILVFRSIQLRSHVSRRNGDLARLESQLSTSTRDLQQLQSQLGTSTRELQEMQSQFNNRVQQIFLTWREREIESTRTQITRDVFEKARNELERSQAEATASIREEAIRRSA